MYLIKDYLPPVVTKSIRAIKNKRKIYRTFHDALKDCKTKGYDSNALAEMIFAKTKNYRDSFKTQTSKNLSTSESFLAASIAKINQSKIKVLDFGGALGTHYFFIRNFFPDIEFDWSIIEMPALVQKGQLLEEPKLKFYEFEHFNTQDKQSFDLVLTSGAIQHVPQPDETIQFLLSVHAKWLIFLRGGFSYDPNHFWVIHKTWYRDNGPGAKPKGMKDGLVDFPFAIVSKSKFEQQLNKEYLEKASMVDNTGLLEIAEKQCVGLNRLYLKYD